MSWLWLWTDILDSEKVAELDDSSFRGWTLFLACAKRHDQEGVLPPIKKLSYWCRQTETTVRGWLSALEESEFIEKNEDTYTMHDWDHWQARTPGRKPLDQMGGKALSNAQRQRRYREAHPRNVTLPSALPVTENNREEESRERITLRNENYSVTNNVIPSVTLPPVPISPPVWNDHQQQCIEQATTKWGASNGDIFVGELLGIFHEDVVMEAMDAYWDKNGRDFRPRLLRGFCQTAFKDKQKKGAR